MKLPRWFPRPRILTPQTFDEETERTPRRDALLNSAAKPERLLGATAVDAAECDADTQPGSEWTERAADGCGPFLSSRCRTQSGARKGRERRAERSRYRFRVRTSNSASTRTTKAKTTVKPSQLPLAAWAPSMLSYSAEPSVLLRSGGGRRASRA